MINERRRVIYNDVINPLSLLRLELFHSLIDVYYDFENLNCQALCEAYHFLPIFIKQHRSDPDLAAYARKCIQRHLRAGLKWRKALQTFSSVDSWSLRLEIHWNPYSSTFLV